MKLDQALHAPGFRSYVYGYPHKTAYRTLEPPVPLEEVWRDEDRSALFLYVHVPFCEMRCGFCNLFTTVRPPPELLESTLSATLRQSSTVAAALSPSRVAQAAIGGGTPSFLDRSDLETLFERLARHWTVDWDEVPVSFEVSPTTATTDKLRLLRDVGVDRISIGVQSFVPAVLKSLGRPDQTSEARRACAEVSRLGFSTLNIDLIYGAQGQTAPRWQRSLEEAVALGAQEIYLYPLYVRELTGLARTGRCAGRLQDLYRQGRDFLSERGYRQMSMRLFRLEGHSEPGAAADLEYSCQEDGMVGLGPGARSYTTRLHYSSEYAVAQQGVRRIVESFAGRGEEHYVAADYGIWLDLEERRRRFVLKSLLRAPGIDLHRYNVLFGSDAREDFPELTELMERALVRAVRSRLCLTDAGLEASDVIGPWLYSDDVRQRMSSYRPA